MICKYCKQEIVIRNSSDGRVYTTTDHPNSVVCVNESPLTRNPLGNLENPGYRWHEPNLEVDFVKSILKSYGV